MKKESLKSESLLSSVFFSRFISSILLFLLFIFLILFVDSSDLHSSSWHFLCWMSEWDDCSSELTYSKNDQMCKTNYQNCFYHFWNCQMTEMEKTWKYLININIKRTEESFSWTFSINKFENCNFWNISSRILRYLSSINIKFVVSMEINQIDICQDKFL